MWRLLYIGKENHKERTNMFDGSFCCFCCFCWGFFFFFNRNISAIDQNKLGLNTDLKQFYNEVLDVNINKGCNIL
jgi:hypothetical protein